MRLIIIIIVLFNTRTLKTQTPYGTVGSLKVPTAYTVDTGKVLFGAGYYRDYLMPQHPETFYNQWAIFANFGFHSRFDLGVRLAMFPQIPLNDSTVRYNINNDRTINAKLIIVKRRKKIPQVAIGLQDFIGTGRFNSTYLVISKLVQINSNTEAVATLGYGAKLHKVFSRKASSRLIGGFGGIDISWKTAATISIEYDSKDFNLGTSLRNKFGRITLFLTDWSQISTTVSCSFTL